MDGYLKWIGSVNVIRGSRVDADLRRRRSLKVEHTYALLYAI